MAFNVISPAAREILKKSNPYPSRLHFHYFASVIANTQIIRCSLVRFRKQTPAWQVKSWDACLRMVGGAIQPRSTRLIRVPLFVFRRRRTVADLGRPYTRVWRRSKTLRESATLDRLGYVSYRPIISEKSFERNFIPKRWQSQIQRPG